MIGILPLMDKERNSYWMLPGYMNGIIQAGGVPVMLPLTADSSLLEQLVHTLDGFLFTGGQDVSPSIYGEQPSPACGECCPARDEMEQILFQLVCRYDKPMLGICRGIQFLNAALGGTLYQDLPSEHPSSVIHCQKPPYDIPSHEVELVSNSPLSDLLKTDRLMVNSYHHQAVKQLSAALRPMAYSPDGLVEACQAPDRRFMWAVQWHPEFSFESDASSRLIFRALTESCK